MVHILVEGLPGIAPDIEIHHVNLSLSHDTADIGRWRPAKLWSAWRAARRAIASALTIRGQQRLRFSHSLNPPGHAPQFVRAIKRRISESKMQNCVNCDW
jgi:hypothetical protein